MRADRQARTRKNQGQRRRPLVLKLIGALGLSLTVLAQTSAGGVGRDLGPDWYVTEQTSEAVFVGQAGVTPKLVIPKSDVLDKSLGLELDTDAKQLVLRSGPEELTMDLGAGQPGELEMVGSRQRPRLALNGLEAGPARGRWIRLLILEPTPTIELSLPGASYANLRWRQPAPSLAQAAQTVAPAPVITIEPPIVTAPQSPPLDDQEPVSETVVAPAATQPADAQEADEPRHSAVPSVHHYPTPGEPPSELEPADHWRFLFHATSQFDTAYFYRGIGQENEGLVQLGAEIRVRPYEDRMSDVFNKLDAVIKLRSFHTFGPTANTPGGGNEKFYELDFDGGVEFTGFERLLLGVYQTNRIGVNQQLADVHAFEAKLAFDDSTPAFPFSLQPYALLTIEYQGDSDGGNPNSNAPGFGQGIYLELGVRPEFELLRIESFKRPITLAVPVRVGLSLSDYFEDPAGQDQFFGYGQIGLELSIPLLTMSTPGDQMVLLDLTTGGSVLFLGSPLQRLSLANGTGDSPVVVIGSVGLEFTY
ncbi:MAG: hypothetical protein IT441_00445 [Phycisphaeraceae bacterium]|nr:hypothetical protein [Phycisphaeraceae bacterium]